MSGRSTEELTLPYKKPIIVASVIIVSVVVTLFGVDRLRINRRLVELQKQFCALAIPDPQLHEVDLLAESGAVGIPSGEHLIRMLNTLAPRGGTFEVFFEARGSVWWVSSWGTTAPSDYSHLPSGFQSWTDLSITDCAGVVEERRLRVVRSVRTPAGRTVVLVLNVDRDRGFD